MLPIEEHLKYIVDKTRSDLINFFQKNKVVNDIFIDKFHVNIFLRKKDAGLKLFVDFAMLHNMISTFAIRSMASYLINTAYPTDTKLNKEIYKHYIKTYPLFKTAFPEYEIFLKTKLVYISFYENKYQNELIQRGIEEGSKFISPESHKKQTHIVLKKESKIIQ